MISILGVKVLDSTRVCRKRVSIKCLKSKVKGQMNVLGGEINLGFFRI